MKPLSLLVALFVLVLLAGVAGYFAFSAQTNRSATVAPLAAPASTATPEPTTARATPRGNDVASCPTTKPPNPPFVPPKPWPAQAPGGEFWHGNANLWTALRPTGTWSALPHNSAGYTQKIFLWPNGGNMPKITVTGKRLDANAPTYSITNGTNACHSDFGGCIMLIGVDMPSLGCWELIVEYAGESLNFVVWVAP